MGLQTRVDFLRRLVVGRFLVVAMSSPFAGRGRTVYLALVVCPKHTRMCQTRCHLEARTCPCILSKAMWHIIQGGGGFLGNPLGVARGCYLSAPPGLRLPRLALIQGKTGGGQKGQGNLMAFVGSDGKARLQAAVRPDLARALEQYGRDHNNRTNQHLIIRALTLFLGQAGYWPVRTAEEKARLVRNHTIRAEVKAKRSSGNPLAPGGGGNPRGGRPIGGDIGVRRIGRGGQSSTFTP